MSKKYLYLFSAALLALSGLGASAQSVQARGVRRNRRTTVTRNYNQYFVKAPQSISANTRTVSGTASRGIHVMLRSSAHKTLASTYANRRTGRYTLRIPKRYAAGTRLYVMGQKSYFHPYRIVLVKTPANQRAASRRGRAKVQKRTVKRASRANRGRKATKKSHKVAKKSTANSKIASQKSEIANLKHAIAKEEKPATKRNVRKSTRKGHAKAVRRTVTINDPTGTWQARQSKHYTQKWTFSQRYGLNETLYHNGRYAKKLVTNAPYHVDPKTTDFWRISYTPQRQRKSRTVYVHFTSNRQFKVTNYRGQEASLTFAKL